ncbi:MAG: [protein-PII] uridylyltransferase [Pirellulales bacterium]|nr:[protein-PII] uridylyltransferase [Pirellulales bacterium]
MRPWVIEAKQQLIAGREKLRHRHSQGSPGIQVCTALTDLYDQVVIKLYTSELLDLHEAGPEHLAGQVALVALGGYGRRDVAPFSDVDLLLLYPEECDGRIRSLSKRLLEDVYDSGLQLGLQVRTIADACQFGTEDAKTCTALMEARLLAGNGDLYERFTRRFQARLRRRQSTLFTAIERVRSEERQQYGETVYLLEPHIKRSQGGLRDLQLLRWIGYLIYGQADPEGLQLNGALAPSDHRVIRQATDFLLRVRNEMHFSAGKSHDVLDKSEQVRLATAFGHTGTDAMLPVEQFMREYFRCTQAATTVINRFIETARPGSRLARWVEHLWSHQVEGDFRVGRRTIWATGSGLSKITTSLDQVLRMADLANLYSMSVDHATCEAVRLAVPQMDHTLTPAARRHFLSLLARPARLGEQLRNLHEMGVLERVVPEFAHARSLLQFNEYHRYTVDEHSLRAVEAAAAFRYERGLLGRIYRAIGKKDILHLALLIHDLGKGYVEDHSELGQRIAAETAARLRLPEHDTEILKFLVHKHLLMSRNALWLDPTDPQLVTRFAVEVGSAEVLQMLYVLTVADFQAVGPGAYNGWRAEMLSILYQGAIQRLASDDPALVPSEKLHSRRSELRAYFARDNNVEWYYRQIDALPASYIYANSADQIADELREMEALQHGEVRARGRFNAKSQITEYTVIANEDIAPGIFHRLTGGLSSQGLEILDADINTLSDGLVFDRFIVQDADYQGEPPPDRIDTVCQTLIASLRMPDGQLPFFRRSYFAANRQQKEALAPQPSQVRFDNSTATGATILTVITHDRPGLLFLVSRKIYELELSVLKAKIGTYLDQVVDVFYVTDPQGRKITDEDRLDSIRQALLESVAGSD